MERLRAGTPAAAARRAGLRTPRLRKHSAEQERSCGYQSRCAGNFWMRSTPGNRSERHSKILD
jgi:hypothetical protein